MSYFEDVAVESLRCNVNDFEEFPVNVSEGAVDLSLETTTPDFVINFEDFFS